MVSEAYRAPSTPVFDPPDAPVGEAEWRAFAGEAAPGLYYGSAWAGERALPAFHWPALLVGALWCFYRRMYLLGAAVLLAEALAGLVTSVALMSIAPDLMADPLGNGARLAAVFGILPVRIPLALLANRMYRRRARSRIGAIQARGLDDASRLAAIEAAGGTRTALVWILVAGNLAFNLAGAILLTS